MSESDLNSVAPTAFSPVKKSKAGRPRKDSIRAFSGVIPAGCKLCAVPVPASILTKITSLVRELEQEMNIKVNEHQLLAQVIAALEWDEAMAVTKEKIKEEAKKYAKLQDELQKMEEYGFK